MNFEFNGIQNVEFGICTRQRGEVGFFDVPVDNEVRQMLQEMTASTWDQMNEVSNQPTAYEPSQAYSGKQHLSIDATDPSVELFRNLQQAVSCEPGGNVLRDPRTIFCYFARLRDGDGQRLVAMRRSSSFKGVLKQKNRIVSLNDDRLRAVGDDLFRLDYDFDVLVDDEEVRILRVPGFETLGSLQSVIREAAYENIQVLQDSLQFVEVGLDELDTSFSVSVARRLASVKNQRLAGITVDSLRAQCLDNNVEFTETKEGLRFEENALEDLLDILDRRRYVDGLVPGEKARYKANSRQRLG